jgi:hypothetical protein
VQYISNPSEEIKRLAVKQNGFMIQYISNPSEEVQKLALKQNKNVGLAYNIVRGNDILSHGMRVEK